MQINELIDQITKRKFNGTQLKILLFIWRHTFGVERKSNHLSLSLICKDTGIHKDQVKYEMNRLVNLNVLQVISEASFSQAREIGINDEIEQWKALVCSEMDNLQGVKIPPVEEEINPEGVNSPPGCEKAQREGANSPPVNQENNIAQGVKSPPPAEAENRVSSMSSLKDINSLRSLKDFKDLKNTTTTEATFFVQKEYASLHGKFPEHVRQKEVMAIKELLESGVSAEFIITSMKQIHKEKLEKDEPVTSFLYYPEAIKRMWKEHTSPNVLQFSSTGGKKSGSVDWDKVKRQLEEAARGQQSGA
ncbi:replication protein [Paenibacillus contaminans]|uniref:Bacteriophage lambda Replication protein O N-terminal domain-containing protein n=1 Tax=Paenibacillus contaminans TaxID=450362 RepID=A0A329MRP8_9BACL|nr:replication protein [Paenibacillus contaminans]RAV22220.1 hypothetical protein DQG23_04515 [Paenibacillus contaminans]